MIFNMVGGSGNAVLNFKIVAYSTKGVYASIKDAMLASKPSENTIGVVTTTPIGSYILSPSEPPVPTSGMLWIAIGTSSNITFNVVKKNAIRVCPVFAKQYINNAWVEVEAMSYVNGWIPWVTYLYNKGDEFMDLTGGWNGYNYKTSTSGSTAAKPTVTKNTDTIKVSLGDLKAGALFTEKAIDLTNISVLSIDVLDVTGGDLPFLAVSKTKAPNYEVTEDDRVQIRKAGTTTLDVSKHQGPYYVVVSLQGSGSKSVTFSSINTRGSVGSSGTGGTQITLETKLVTPTKEGFDVTPTPGMALSKVTVEPIPDQYQDVSDSFVTPNMLTVGGIVYNSDGEQITGENPYEKEATDEVVDNQYELIQQIKAALETKSSASGVELPDIAEEDLGAASDLAEGKKLIGPDGNIVTGTLIEVPSGSSLFGTYDHKIGGTEGDTTFNVAATWDGASLDGVIMRGGTCPGVRNVPTSMLGDAELSDVAKGKTFTSAAGYLAVGTREESNVQLPSIDESVLGTAFDLAKGKQLISSDGTVVTGEVETYQEYEKRCSPVELDGQLLYEIKLDAPILVRDYVTMNIPLSDFGEAGLSDVRAGVTFTSKNGLKLTGNMETSSDGVQLPDIAEEELGTASDLLAGKKLIGSDGELIIGSMTNNGSFSKTIDGINNEGVFGSKGYYSGVSVTFDDSAIVSLLDSL